jgi:hypothetical protein
MFLGLVLIAAIVALAGIAVFELGFSAKLVRYGAAGVMLALLLSAANFEDIAMVMPLLREPVVACSPMIESAQERLNEHLSAAMNTPQLLFSSEDPTFRKYSLAQSLADRCMSKR